MSKNPFMNCKSRKRRKTKIPATEPKEKLFCPRTMVRYDLCVNEYPTNWVCKMCLKCLLSEAGVKNHLANCLGVSGRALPEPVKKVEKLSYVCQYCNKIFARWVTLKKHLEEHEGGAVSESSEDEVAYRPIKTEYVHDDNDEFE